MIELNVGNCRVSTLFMPMKVDGSNPFHFHHSFMVMKCIIFFFLWKVDQTDCKNAVYVRLTSKIHFVTILKKTINSIVSGNTKGIYVSLG